MTLTKEQISALKAQLLSQISHLPPEKKAEAKAQIDSLSTEALETILKQQQANDVFRLIASKEIESVIVDENSDALAALEINPVSKGHTIIVPKTPFKDQNKIPSKIKEFAEKVQKKILSSLKPKSVHIIPDIKFGEVILDLVPEYDSPVSLSSKRSKASKDELKDVLRKINVIKIEKKVEQIKVEKPKEEIVKRGKRIP